MSDKTFISKSIPNNDEIFRKKVPTSLVDSEHKLEYLWMFNVH